MVVVVYKFLPGDDLDNEDFFFFLGWNLDKSLASWLTRQLEGQISDEVSVEGSLRVPWDWRRGSQTWRCNRTRKRAIDTTRVDNNQTGIERRTSARFKQEPQQSDITHNQNVNSPRASRPNTPTTAQLYTAPTEKRRRPNTNWLTKHQFQSLFQPRPIYVSSSNCSRQTQLHALIESPVKCTTSRYVGPLLGSFYVSPNEGKRQHSNCCFWLLCCFFKRREIKPL